jgi:transcriptional regulator with XRE-family HTH domain
MQTLGERLEEARKRKGLSIREAAEATKIRGDYLQKFEANSFDFDLPPLYIRGFLRTYAKYLEFDPARIVSEFDTMMADEGRAPRRETRENYGRVELGGDSGESAPRSSGGGNGLDPVMLKYALFGGGALVLVVVVVLLINVLSSRSEPRPTPQRPAVTENNSAANAQPAGNDAAAAQTLTFTASDVTRLKIVRDADKSVLFDGALGRGETRTFRKAGKLLVTVEKGSNLRMEVNGRSYPVPLEGYGRFALD